MKQTYPDYQKTGLNSVRESLSRTNKNIMNDYLKFVKITAGEEKLKQYEIYMLQLIDIIEKPLSRITKEEAEEFWGIINHSKKSIPTKNAIRLTVKRFLKWKYKDLNMIENLKMQKHLVDRNKRSQANNLTADDLDSMLRTANNFRNKLIISLLWETAGRPEEIRLLKFNNIDFQNKLITLYSNKTKQSRELPFHKSLGRLEAWKKDYQFSNVNDNDFIFPSQTRNKPLSASFFTKLIKKIAIKAGIKRTITPYSFRHSRLQDLYDRGVSDLLHRKFSGHSTDSKMTSVYVEMDDKKMQEAVKSLYDVEPTTEEKNKYEKQIAELQKHQKLVSKTIKLMNLPGVEIKQSKEFKEKHSKELKDLYKELG